MTEQRTEIQDDKKLFSICNTLSLKQPLCCDLCGRTKPAFVVLGVDNLKSFKPYEINVSLNSSRKLK